MQISEYRLTCKIVKRQSIVTHRHTLLSNGALFIVHVLQTKGLQSFRVIFGSASILGPVLIDSRVFPLSFGRAF